MQAHPVQAQTWEAPTPAAKRRREETGSNDQAPVQAQAQTTSASSGSTPEAGPEKKKRRRRGPGEPLARGYSMATPRVEPRSEEEAHLGFNAIKRPADELERFAFPRWRWVPGTIKIRENTSDADQIERIRGIIISGTACKATEIAREAALNGNPWTDRRVFMQKHQLYPNANASTRERFNIEGKITVLQDMKMFSRPRTPFVSVCRPQVVDYRREDSAVLFKEYSESGKIRQPLDECRANPVWVREWVRRHPLAIDTSAAEREVLDE